MKHFPFFYTSIHKVYIVNVLTICVRQMVKTSFNCVWICIVRVLSGLPGQFQCGNKRCEKQEGLKSWEVNFAYVEHGEKRNALVKLSK